MKFSVVIPVYNGENYIRRSVQSALAQRGVELEVVVINDGSTDSTESAAKDVSEKVVVVSTRNAGQAAARNRGIREATGDFIAFLDADDWWESDKLASQKLLFESALHHDVVFNDFRGQDLEGTSFGWQGGLKQQLTERGLRLSSVNQDLYTLEGNIVEVLLWHTSFMHPSAVTVRKSLINRVGLFDESMSPAEDFEMWIRLAEVGRFGYVDRISTVTEARPGSQGRQTIRMDEQLIRLYSGIPARFPSLPSDLITHLQSEIELKHRALAWRYKQVGNRTEAVRHYRAALRHRFRFTTLISMLRFLISGAK